MEMISKNFNQISKGLGSVILAFLFLIAITLILTTMPEIFAQSSAINQTIMNASISQVIGIKISDWLAEGILFTNTTTIGYQYAITDMLAWNNATRNYNASNFGTLYNITASSDNKVNITVCHCACSDLTNTTGGNTYYLYLNDTLCSSDEGVNWANSTTSETALPHNPTGSGTYNFTKPQTSQIIAGRLDSGESVWLRYWLNPCPNTVPSGIYTTTYKIIAVEHGTNCIDCSQIC